MRRTPLDYWLALPGGLRFSSAVLSAGVVALTISLALAHPAKGNPFVGVSVVLSAVGIFSLLQPWPSKKQYADALDEVVADKPIRYRSRRLIVQPDGEHVTILVYDRADGHGPCRHRLHAEHEADKAHAIVSEFKNRPRKQASHTPEARALARVLTERKSHA